MFFLVSDLIVFCFFLQVGLWIFGGVLNVDAVTAAILGLSILLITGVVTWKECLAESVAWDTLTWFAALIAMAGYLNKYGLISWFSQTVVKFCFLFLLLGKISSRNEMACWSLLSEKGGPTKVSTMHIPKMWFLG